jgi:H+/Cl- antiporter ClcA
MSMTKRATPSRRPGWLPTLLGTGIGAAVGFGVGAAIYLLLAPILEDSSGLVRELQGLLWNLVPLLTVCGALAGWLLMRRASPRDVGRRPPEGLEHR